MAVTHQPISKSGKAELVITRTFYASKELVFKAFSEADRLARWWGPKGYRTQVVHLDFHPGGIFHYSMEGNGETMYGRFIYGHIRKPDSLEFVDSFADEHAKVIRAPFNTLYPLEVFNTVTLSEKDRKTTLTLKSYPLNATEEEVKAFIDLEASMQEGFKGTFDQLEEYLSTL